MWTWKVSICEAGQPLLTALALRLPAVPAGLLRQLVRKGRIACDGVTVGEELVAAAGMTIALRSSRRLDELVAASGLEPEQLLFEDRHTLVVNKPAGLAVHRAAGIDTHLQGAVARFLAWRHAPYRAHPVHRLDIGTSGPVLFGKGREAAGGYGRLLMAGGFTKRYLAVVSGVVPATGELVTPVVDGGRNRAALSRYRRLSAAGPYALLDLELVTGRNHQLRQQLAAAGWPIVGDRRYGGGQVAGLAHPLLHCRQLLFPLLAGGGPCRVEVLPPAAFRRILDNLGFPRNDPAVTRPGFFPPQTGQNPL